jgi:gamma-glutamylcyclotransferase (GGCT)/AIG2-like uncharacterized protein YtfP
MLVAVYGTLRKGGGNDILLSGSEYKGSFRTEPIFTMFNIGCPYVSTGGTDSITVEVYSISDETLRWLDQLENYPGLYDRTQIDTPWGKAWMYIIDSFHFNGASYVPSGDWMKRYEEV